MLTLKQKIVFSLVILIFILLCITLYMLYDSWNLKDITSETYASKNHNISNFTDIVIQNIHNIKTIKISMLN